VKRLQKMMIRIHSIQRAVTKRLGTKTVAYDRVLLNFDDRGEEFSCSSTPVKGNEQRSWDDHLHSLLFRALPCNSELSANEPQNGSPSIDESPKSPMDDLWRSPQVDRRAEEFITEFYKQMRLQRQDSYQQCQEMLARAT